MEFDWLRRQAFILSLLAVSLCPFWAWADGCRIFIASGVNVDQAQIKKKGYEILPLKGNARDMRELFDIALMNGALHNIEVWMRVTETYGGPVGVLPDGDAQYLPECNGRASLATVGYFRSNFGELARRRLDQFYLARKSSPGLGEVLLRIEALRAYGSLNFKEKADEWTANWEILVSSVKSDWQRTEGFPIYDRLDRIRKTLQPNLGFTVEKGRGNLSAALSDNPGGDSFYQTQLMLAALIDAGISAGPDRAFGIQLYDDYRRPVIVEGTTGKIYDLVSGTQQEADAPIYSPELITFGIASAAGRAVDFERDFYLKLTDMKMSSFNVGLVVKKFLGIEKPEKDWRQLDSNFGSASSKVATDTIRLGSYPLGTKLAVVKSTKGRNSGGGGGGGLSDGSTDDSDPSEQAEGAGVRRSYNPTKRSADGTSSSEEFAKEILPLFWSQIPEKDRPTEAEQVLLTRTALWTYTDPQEYSHLLRILPHFRVAEPSELRLFMDDLDFAFVPNSVKKMFDKMDKDGKKISVTYPGFEVVFRDAEKLKQYTGGYFDPIDFPDDLKNSLNGLTARAMRGVNIPQLRQWLEHPELLIPADTGAVAKSLENLISAIEVETQATQTLWFTLKSSEEISQTICDLAFTAAQSSLQYGRNAAQKLEAFDKLDPFKRIAFVKNIRAIHRIWTPLHTQLEECQKKAPDKSIKTAISEALLNPLDVLASHLALSTLEFDKYEAKAQMHVMSDTMFFELLEGTKTAQPKPPTEAMVTQEPVPVIAQSIPGPKAAPNIGKLPISSEAFFALLMGTSVSMLHNPLIQLLSGVVWDEALTNHYQDFWRSSPDAEDRVLTLWNWGKILRAPSLPDLLKRRIAVIRAADGLYVKAAGFNFGDAKIPKHLMSLIRGSLLSKGASKVTWQSTPANSPVTETRVQPDWLLNYCLVAANISTGSVFYEGNRLAAGDKLLVPVKIFNAYVEYPSRVCPHFDDFEYFITGEAPVAATEVSYSGFYSNKAFGNQLSIIEGKTEVKKALE